MNGGLLGERRELFHEDLDFLFFVLFLFVKAVDDNDARYLLRI